MACKEKYCCSYCSHYTAPSSSIPLCIHLPILIFGLFLINRLQKHTICTSRSSYHSVCSHKSPHSRRANCTVCLLVSAYHLNDKLIIFINPVPPKLFVSSFSSATCKVFRNSLKSVVVKVSCVVFLFYFPGCFFPPLTLLAVITDRKRQLLGIHMC